jgi:glycosyltransferase involved in cell wall biosynthesis
MEFSKMHAGIVYNKKHVGIYIIRDLFNCGEYYKVPYDTDILKYLREYQKRHRSKIVVCGIEGAEKKVYSDLWKYLDILCGPVKTHGCLEEKSFSAARKSYAWIYHESGIPMISLGKQRSVNVDGNFILVQLEDYRRHINSKKWARIMYLANIIKKENKSITFINTTFFGGGVSIIRHGMIRFLKLLDIKCNWFVMKPNPKVFEITKTKIHNVLQGIVDIELTDEDKEIYQEWCLSNFNDYWKHALNTTLLVIDDPQPSGLIKSLKSVNKKTTFLYRSHIELRSDLINDPNTVQYNTWQFLWENIKECHYFISHPIDDFIPDIVRNSNMEIDKIPASGDCCDGLNKKLDNHSLEYYKLLFNKISFDQINKKVDFNRPYFIQVCRFDPSKGIPDLIKAYVLFRKKNENKVTPQLIITGNASIDDVETSKIYNQIINQIKELPSEIGKDIFAILLPSNDQLLNTMISCCLITFQLSIREGFEIKVSESLLKGKVVIGYRSGGIVLQIQDSFDGFLVETGDIETVANLMHKLVNDSKLLKQMSDNALQKCRDWILIPSCVLTYLEIMIKEMEK